VRRFKEQYCKVLFSIFYASRDWLEIKFWVLLALAVCISAARGEGFIDCSSIKHIAESLFSIYASRDWYAGNLNLGLN
jgi:hypothetical protein